MRRLLVAATAAVLFGLAAGPAAAVPPHLHCVTTQGGNVHPIAGGVTFQAPHDTAFHAFHANVHQGAFTRGNPNEISADQTLPFTCPPS